VTEIDGPSATVRPILAAAGVPGVCTKWGSCVVLCAFAYIRRVVVAAILGMLGKGAE
jgi:hypothetical protein